MQNSPVDRRRLFTCPGCDEQIIVDPGVEELLLTEGCFICAMTVSKTDFEPIDDGNSNGYESYEHP